MTDITSLSIPKELIQTARSLDINCSKIARDAIAAAIKNHTIKDAVMSGSPVKEG